ncbi:hypothetical protein IAU59_007236 [Kwoniella sp. CBS 9459]
MNTPEFSIPPLPFSEEDLWDLFATPSTLPDQQILSTPSISDQPGIDPRAISLSPATAHYPHSTAYDFGANPLLDFAALSSPPSSSIPLSLAPPLLIGHNPCATSTAGPISTGLDVQVEQLSEDNHSPDPADNETETVFDSDSSSASDSDEELSGPEISPSHGIGPDLTSATAFSNSDRAVIDPILLSTSPPVRLIQPPSLIHKPLMRPTSDRGAPETVSAKKAQGTKTKMKIEVPMRTVSVKKEVVAKKGKSAKRAAPVSSARQKVDEPKPRSARLDLLARQKGSKRTKPKAKVEAIPPATTNKAAKPKPASRVPDEAVSPFVNRRKIPPFPHKRSTAPARPAVSENMPRKSIVVSPGISAPQAFSAPPSPAPSSDTDNAGSDYAPSPSPVPSAADAEEPKSKSKVKGRKRALPTDVDEDWEEKPSSKRSRASKGKSKSAQRRSETRFGTGRNEQNQRAQAKYRNKVKDRGVLTTRYLGRLLGLFHGKKTSATELRKTVGTMREEYLKELGDLDSTFALNFVEQYLAE